MLTHWKLVPRQATDEMLDAFSGSTFRALPIQKQVAEIAAYEKMLRAVPIPSIAELEREKIRTALAFAQLEELCGYWQDSSDTVVQISQDDACRCFVVRVGKETFTGPTLIDALNLASGR